MHQSSDCVEGLSADPNSIILITGELVHYRNMQVIYDAYIIITIANSLTSTFSPLIMSP